MSEEDFMEEFSEEESVESEATSSVQIKQIKTTLLVTDLWEEALEGKISIKELKELKEKFQSELVERGKGRRRRRKSAP
ncbi:hypothetical protein EYM_02340 [Ignicoccus islandicus DSM 13165]|uniref:RNA polymerase Rpo13 subunit HTH domain-containing protein n=1 Tax=Ignicoccus islandicus DSM 13165 TaxID=940295 RepID=A0A0U3DXT9_9CREN|nr:hypothetical protein [Ignicoccus islandicus]ALU12314.1 hypothetical protein EYM_02340 [Ignicoccus islandicus DSM 13165]